VPQTSKLLVTGWRLPEGCKSLGDKPQSELWSKTRELALGDVSGPARWCVVELGLDQNLVGWCPAAPSDADEAPGRSKC